MTTPRRPLSLAQTIILGLLLPLWSCSGGNGPAGPMLAGATVSAKIGPAGGQISSSDGVLTLNFPVGALAATETISITTLQSSEFSAEAQAVAADQGWRIEPAGLAFSLPVELTVDRGQPPEGTGEDRMVDAMALFDFAQLIGAIAQVTNVNDEEDDFYYARCQILNAADVYAKVGRYGTTRVTPLTSIPPGGSAPVDAEITPFPPVTTSNEEWSAVSTGGVTDDLGTTPSPFNGNFNLFCPAMGAQGTVRVTIEFTAVRPQTSGAAGFSESVSVEFVFSAGCSAGTSGSVVDGVSSLGGILKDVESAQAIVTAGSNFAPPNLPNGNVPFILCAGGLPNGNGPGAAIVDPTGATAPIQIPVGGFGTAFDAHLIPSPDGTREALWLTGGSEGILIETFTGGQLAMGAQITMGFHEDAQPVAMDPVNGVAAARGASITIASVDDQSGPQFQSFSTSQQISSAVVNVARDRALIIRALTHDLAMAVLDPVNSTVVSEASVTFLGTTPRRARWDPASGLGGVTDFSDDTVTVFEWDGQTMPTIIGTATVGSGPVGFDVFDDQILCVGFNDDSLTRIEVDLVSDTITVVDTNPIPFTPINGGSFSPGHVKILRDPLNSIAISNFGDDSVTFMNSAYP